MGLKYDLTTQAGLSHQSWMTRPEQTRFRDILLAYGGAQGVTPETKAEDIKVDVFREMLFEDLVRHHLWMQRLIDRRYFWNMEPTDYATTGSHEQYLSPDDSKRKMAEFDKYYATFMKTKIDLYKLALANEIKLEGVFDLTNVIQEYQTMKTANAQNSINNPRAEALPSDNS